MIAEKERSAASGLFILVLLLAAVGVTIYALVLQIQAMGRLEAGPVGLIVRIVLLAIEIFLLGGLFMVNPNEGAVLQLFGDYVGHREGSGPALGQSFLQQEEGLPAGQEFRDGTPEGERSGWQPD